MKPLSTDALRNPDLYQYYQGMKNVCYLAGYVRRENPNVVVPSGTTRQFWLQLTNNENLMLPVTLPTGIELPRRVTDRQGLKVICQVRGWRNEKNEPELRIFARSFSRINALEMPPLTAFEKAVPDSAPETAGFKPFGSGFRNNSASNKVELAGILSGKRYRPPVGDKGAAIFLLLRQTADPSQDIPLIYYGKLAEKLSEDLPVGAAIFVSGRYRMTNVEPTTDINEVTGKPYVTGTPLIQIDVPSQPVDRDILYIDEINGARVRWTEKTPKWIFEVSNRRPRNVEAQAGSGVREPAVAEAGAASTATSASEVAARPGSPLSDEERRALGL
ncbi:hypothetical protein KDW40_02195 [Burkholderia cenocepacia]|uniref:hypothetical protein n=1 Tax=Burkholderia cenocepacia TaxID=95486 RepID=UPI001B9A66CB|nr:hypothetical protein [Burkholderia cenocepacia]MBR8043376.1 hypothetical protein [Burkholderia cenocepacia]MBR8324541.1 hypothetical protein [Burkholderia cenocepacia]